MRKLTLQTIKTNFNFPPYHTNAYLFELNEGVFLFDTGIKDIETIETLKEAIKKKGKIDGIILSHGHLDHAGCASILSEHYNIPIYVSMDEKDRISYNFDERLKTRIEKIRKTFEFLGINKKSFEILEERTNYYKNLFKPIEFCFNVEKIRLSDIEVLKLPGHTTGSIGLYFKENKLLLSGDALLEEGISPFFDPELLIDSLALYLQTLMKLKSIELKAVLPGHGNKITNPQKIINDHIKYINKNQKKIRRLLKQNYKIPDILEIVFPKNQNQIIILSEIIHCLESLKIPILQNLKDLL